jgi:DnaJ-class molecular chaperone
MWRNLPSLKKTILSPFSTNNKDYYSKFSSNLEILGITRSASQSDIKNAYYNLAQLYHPDKNDHITSKDLFS